MFLLFLGLKISTTIAPAITDANNSPSVVKLISYKLVLNGRQYLHQNCPIYSCQRYQLFLALPY